MAKVFVEDYEMTAIADGIRKASGRTDKMLPSVMAEVANGLSAGGGESQLDALIDGGITEVYSNANKIKSYVFNACKNLTTATFPIAKDVEYTAFNACSNLVTVSIPSATNIASEAFYNCSKLTNVNAPAVISIGSTAFKNCSNLSKTTFTHVTTIGSSSFDGCARLIILDFPAVTTINNKTFNDCASLKVLIIRSETVCSMASSTSFTNCCHFTGDYSPAFNPNSDKDAYIYVPRVLIDSYKTATNWSAFYTSCGYEIFRALEDYTVDGTTTGALDESKI